MESTKIKLDIQSMMWIELQRKYLRKKRVRITSSLKDATINSKMPSSNISNISDSKIIFLYWHRHTGIY